MVSGKPVWACNLCSDTLDSEEEMIIHMQESPKRVFSKTEGLVSSCKDGNCVHSANA